MSTMSERLYQAMLGELVRGGRFPSAFTATDLFRYGTLVFTNDVRTLPEFLRQAEADGFVTKNGDGRYSLARGAPEAYKESTRDRASPATHRPVTLPGFGDHSVLHEDEASEVVQGDTSPQDFNPRFMDAPDPDEESVEPMDLGDESASETETKPTGKVSKGLTRAVQAKIKERHRATLRVIERLAGPDGLVSWLEVRDTLVASGLGVHYKSIGNLCGDLVRRGYLHTLGNDNRRRRYRITDQGRRLMQGS